MKKRKDEFSNSITKYSINLSQDNLKEKKSRFEFLYENSSIHDKKLDLIRAKNYYKQQERMTPNISKKSKDLKRPKELFYKRLYRFDNEPSIDIGKIKKNMGKNKLKLENEKKLNKGNKENEKNNSISNNSEDSKDENQKSFEEENLYIMDNKKKNEQYKKYYKNSSLRSRNTLNQ